MNREGRRLQQKRRNAMAKELMRAEKPPEYGQGFHDGGSIMCKACDISFAKAMEEAGFQSSTIVRVLVKAHNKLEDYVLENDKVEKEYREMGIRYNSQAVFSDEIFEEG